MEPTPLLFLHGIRGSRLAECGLGPSEIIWQLSREDHPRAYQLALRMDKHGRCSAAQEGVRVLPLDLEETLYGSFLDHLRRDRGAESSLAAPPFDWRLTPSQALEGIAGELPRGPELDVVTHSMGLLLLSEALSAGLLEYGMIRRLALVTPPFGGSLDVLAVLLSGRDPDPEAGSSESYGSMVRDLPALYHLLPHPDYELLTTEAGRPLDPLEADFWPAQIMGARGEYRTALLRQLEAARACRLRLDRLVEELPDRLGERTLIVAGSGCPTPASLRAASSGELLDAEPARRDTRGDGRLALQASRPPGWGIPRLIFGDPGRPILHGDILRSGEVIDCIAGWMAEGATSLEKLPPGSALRD